MNKKLKIFIISFIVLFALTTTAIIFIMNFIDNSKDYMKAFPSPTPSETQESIANNKNIEAEMTVESTPSPEPAFTDKKDRIVNILFLGIDRTIDRDETMGVYRTDTVMFASINLNSKKVEVLSIPRDSYVYIPVIGKKDKINHAYVWGGMNGEGIKSTINTVNNFIKYAKVDYYFAIDREPVSNIVDDLGGVEMDVDIDIKYGDIDISKGYQLLDGHKALDYILWRYSGNGDIDRIKRQQKFMKAMYEKVKKDGNIVGDLKLFLSYNKFMQTDLSYSQMLALSNFFMGISNDDIEFYDTPGYGQYIDDISYWIPDEEIVQIFNR